MSRSRMQLRADRARNGSNRQRDREALARERHLAEVESEATRREKLLADTAPTERARDLWFMVRQEAKKRLSASTYAIWIEPVECVGEVNMALHLEGPAWTCRRYARLLGGIARDLGNECKGVYMTVAEAAPAPEEPK